ncbi:hypothetical protein HK101_007094 [Irineochytrium annulatum]|nr:hypothetical protein HK101_007094 [Irineochytrium annulatum]
MDVLGFGQLFRSTIKVEDLPDLTGQVIVITGASAGLGKVSTEMLASRGADVIMACRNTTKASAVRDSIITRVPAAKLTVMELDLTSLASVRNFALQFTTSRPSRLDVLLCNAGIMATPKRTMTADGVELQTQSNHLGHFYLTVLLLPLLKRTAEAQGGARVVFVSSAGHLFPNPSPLDLKSATDPKARGYFSYGTYGRTKLMNILMTRELQRRCDALLDGTKSRIRVNCCHPGVVETELYKSASMIPVWLVSRIAGLVMMNERSGAMTQVWLAASGEVVREDYGGQYFVPVAQLAWPSGRGIDGELGRELWEWSERVVEERGLKLSL